MLRYDDKPIIEFATSAGVTGSLSGDTGTGERRRQLLRWSNDAFIDYCYCWRVSSTHEPGEKP
jgi:hypothetical protein